VFRYPRQVQFAETDLAGIVHFSNYFRYMEEAEHALWRATGCSIESAGSESGWPRVAAAFEYKRPLKFEDQFEVRVSIVSATSRTIKYGFTIVCGDVEIGSGAMTSVHAQKFPDGSLRAVPIPQGVVDRLRAAVSGT
jgi:acyl-CoA thioester hydrolase